MLRKRVLKEVCGVELVISGEEGRLGSLGFIELLGERSESMISILYCEAWG